MEQNNKPQEGQKDVFAPIYSEPHPTVRRFLCQRIRDDLLNSLSSKLSQKARCPEDIKLLQFL